MQGCEENGYGNRMCHYHGFVWDASSTGQNIGMQQLKLFDPISQDHLKYRCSFQLLHFILFLASHS